MRSIPSIDELLRRPALRRLEAEVGHETLVEALRLEAAALRRLVAAGAPAPADVAAAIERAAPAQIARLTAPSLTPVINATGVIVHTNLGRAPLPGAAVERVAALAAYSNLEYDLESGRRGRRDLHAERLLRRLTGAAAALVVNNNAAATLVALAALASQREVLISRGELVEIGGGFRVPDVMAQSGARLREVGTTNRTRASDYAAAIGERTAAILRVHPSNFRIEGFTARPALEELTAIARQHGLPVIDDIGSGWLGEPAPPPAPWPHTDRATGHGAATAPLLADEPTPAASLAAGADVVLFSGDKLLGGPQCGIIVGSASAVASIRAHPLIRALRVDKMTYAALEATLVEHAAGRARDTVPVTRMLTMTVDQIASRAARIAAALECDDLRVEVIDGRSTVGGGSAPGTTLPTRLVALAHHRLSSRQLEERLRAHHPPVIARIEDDRVLLDLRTVAPEEEALVIAAVEAASAEPSA